MPIDMAIIKATMPVRGNNMLTAAAKEKAVTVCPEGNEFRL